MSFFDAVDLFAGPGGWDVASRRMGLRTLGLELDAAACQTRAAAGHPTIRCDVARYPTAPFTGIRGHIGSPPCQGFSRAGKRGGIGDLALAHRAVADLAAGRDTRAELAAQCKDERTILVAEPMRYAAALRPEWICLARDAERDQPVGQWCIRRLAAQHDAATAAGWRLTPAWLANGALEEVAA